jgi:hypothetical protein
MSVMVEWEAGGVWRFAFVHGEFADSLARGFDAATTQVLCRILRK